MEYCNLGCSGLQVSRLGLGAIPFGTKLDEKECQNLVDAFYDIGGNFIDTSNIYGGGIRGSNTKMAGTSERVVGKAIKGKRDHFIIASKGYWLTQDDVWPNYIGLSRTYLAKNIEESLIRLDTEYIDLYQCHVWDFYTPVEETMRVLDDFVRSGKIRYIGVSNWDGWHVVKANGHIKYNGLTPIISNQIWYTLADRVAENSIIPACKDQKVAIIAWGALAQGFLTGKYNRGDVIPDKNSRFKDNKDTEMSSFKLLANERNWNVLDIMNDIAKKYSFTVPTIAIRWLLQSGNCDVVLLGGSKIQQYIENFNVLNFRLTDEDFEKLRITSELLHPYPISFYDLFCKYDSQFYGGPW
ncbi:MAG: aldo/keto reductase [Actinobacteria bacterium]|nr:aldo/keto reductase [Actinomycetota bacterium]